MNQRGPLEYCDDDGRPFPAQAWTAVYFTRTPGRYLKRLILADNITEALAKAEAVLYGRRIKALIHRDIYR